MAQDDRRGEVVRGGPPTRRRFLLMLGLALNAVVALLVAIPVLGYLFGPIRRRAAQSWILLGPIERFPTGETRLATYENPFRVAWDGPTAHIACWVRRTRGRAVPGVCHQLHASRLPGALVRALTVVYVSLPWRGVL